MSDRPDFTLPVSIEAITIDTLPIDITAQTLGTVAIDIASQTLGQVDINIAASAVTLDINIASQASDVDVNIAASAVTLNVDITAQSVQDLNVLVQAGVGVTNYGQIINGDFEETRSVTRGNIALNWVDNLNVHESSGVNPFSGFKCITLKKQLTAFNGIFQSISPNIPTDNIATFTILARYYTFVGGGDFKVELVYSDGTKTTQTITVSGSTWTKTNLTYTAGKYVIGIRIYTEDANFTDFDRLYLDALNLKYREELQGIIDTVDIDIVAQSVGNIGINIAASDVTLDINLKSSDITLDINIKSSEVSLNVKTTGAEKVAIDIAAQTVGNVDVNIAAQSANVDVDIKAQTVDLNIKTSGGVNLVIDKLTQTAYTERRGTISNNGETASWWSPTGDVRRGKFFPRGMRGFIETIDVYCKDDAAAGGTISVYISPHPSMGYVATAAATVTAGQSAAWKSATFNRMWNYDSLFIFIVCSVSDVKAGYDSGAPYDAYNSSDAGVTWTADVYRFWIRVVMKGETVGDLPVSGTINTIEIPSAVAHQDEGATGIETGATETLATFNGAGHLLRALFYAAHDDMTVEIHCDGTKILAFSFSVYNSWGYGATTPGIQILKFTDGGDCYAQVLIQYSFTRKLELKMYNYSGATKNARAYAEAAMIR